MLHVPARQVAPRQSSPEQQSLSVVHPLPAWPQEAQVGFPGVPPVQPRSVQHWALVVQAPPQAWQGSTQVPPGPQVPLQQEKPAVQTSPFGRQARVQAPPTQASDGNASSQQSADDAHRVPGTAAHPQMRADETGSDAHHDEQHSLASAQGSPESLHAGGGGVELPPLHAASASVAAASAAVRFELRRIGSPPVVAIGGEDPTNREATATGTCAVGPRPYLRDRSLPGARSGSPTGVREAPGAD